MKPLLLAALFWAVVPQAQAQFNPPAGPEQTIDLHAGNATDSRSSHGSPGWLNASASEHGIDASGNAFSSSASASTRIGPGYLSGSLATSVTGSGSSTSTLTAYQTDALTFTRKDGSFDPELIVHYNIVIAGGTSASMSGGDGGTTQAGSLDWTLVHQLDGFYTTAWQSTTTLAHDGSVVTDTQWNSSPINGVYAVYSFSAAISAGYATDMDFYLEMNSHLNAAGQGGTASMAANAPTILWGGISQVTDWNGNVIDYSVSSASGFNYALSAALSPAPEPSTWALLIAGVAALGLRARSISRMRRGEVGPASSIV
ncbi:hypothetical protein ABE85_06670 [Mitsuaria sp. 7]|nr:hypothetical protein ABE85_06670 [Mitsuaria sp. 7]